MNCRLCRELFLRPDSFVCKNCICASKREKIKELESQTAEMTIVMEKIGELTPSFAAHIELQRFKTEAIPKLALLRQQLQVSRERLHGEKGQLENEQDTLAERQKKLASCVQELKVLKESHASRMTTVDRVALEAMKDQNAQLRYTLSVERSMKIANLLMFFPVRKVVGTYDCTIGDLRLPINTPLTDLPGQVALAALSYIVHTLHVLVYYLDSTLPFRMDFGIEMCERHDRPFSPRDAPFPILNQERDLIGAVQKVFANVMYLCEQMDLLNLAIEPTNLLSNVLVLFSHPHLGFDPRDIPKRETVVAAVEEDGFERIELPTQPRGDQPLDMAHWSIAHNPQPAPQSLPSSVPGQFLSRDTVL